MTKKHFYIPGKKYEWTNETWEAAEAFDENNAFECGPFNGWSGNVRGATEYSAAGYFYKSSLDVYWEYVGSECNWTFSVFEQGVEIPEYLVKFYGEEESVPNAHEWFENGGLPPVGTKFEYSFGDYGVWFEGESLFLFDGGTKMVAKCYTPSGNKEITIDCRDDVAFRPIPVEPSYEEKISEKYNIPVDTVNQMMQDGLIKTNTEE